MKILSTISAVDLRIKPQDAAYALRNAGYLCFLDSSLSGNKYSRFSYIAWDPKIIIKSNGYKNEFTAASAGISYYSYQHPLSFLKQNVKEYTCAFPGSKIKNVKIVLISGGKVRKISKGMEEGLPDFKGGFIGYFSYDLKNYIEKLPCSAVDDLNIPLFYLLYYDRVLAYSHLEEMWYFIKNFTFRDKEAVGKAGKDKAEKGSGSAFDADYFKNDYIDSKIKDKDLIRRVNESLKETARIIEEAAGKSTGTGKDVGSGKGPDIRKDITKKYYSKNISAIKLHPNITKRSYLKKVSRTKEYIHNGDIYQANFSQRFEADLPVEPMDLYYILREKNAAPFSAFLKFPDFIIGSSSPERFLFLKGETIETRPIKGTRPRGKDAAGDYKNMHELEGSIKDRAELNMIVDLERNDMGKICYYGTVKVSEHAVIEKFARVFHSVSTVTGKVKKAVDISDIIKAAFPGGSITGAPKIRAMEIIDELEPAARGVYTGSIGYMGIDSTIDLNIVIRTFVIKGNKFYYNVGGGIVEDSVPEDEYEETLDKGIALEDTLKFFTKKNLKKLVQA